MTTTEKKSKPKTEKKKAELKPYMKKEWLEKNYPTKSAGQLAREQGVSRAAILHQLRKHGIKIVTRSSPKTGPGHFKKEVNRSFHQKEFLIEKLKNGLSVNKIAALCGTSHGQVAHFVRKYHLEEMAEKAQIKKQKPAKKTKKK